MDHLLAARAQMGTSLAFHIVFASLGVGLPVLMCLAEAIGLRRNDPTWLLLARRWSKAFGALFAVGAVSGTILSFELGLLWPAFMAYAGPVVGLPFSAEGFAFFVEAIFVALYLYGWERLSPLQHWLCSLPIVLSGAASAWFVVTANAWMNSPTGFRIDSGGNVVDVQPLVAMFNPSTPTETAHMMSAAYVATAFGTAMVYALAMLRRKRDGYHQRALALAMGLALVTTPLMGITGDANARAVANLQPPKLAAMEALFSTGRGVPLHIGGWPDPATGHVIGAVEIPYALSLLVAFDPNATIQGLDAVPPDLWPNVWVVHFAFDLMVGLGFALQGVAIWFWWMFLRRRRVPDGRVLLWCIAASGIGSFTAIEAGWTVTEVGRQPWVIYNVLRTADAVTTMPGLTVVFAGFSVLYVILAAMLWWLLARFGATYGKAAADAHGGGYGVGRHQPGHAGS
jgi:cytochrome d ubiquinol oxidase subunit I